MVKYTLFVDETGDTGLEKVRHGPNSRGASPFLVLGGCLVPDRCFTELRDLLETIREELGKKDLHCTNLNHFQMARFCREVVEHAKVLLFALVSTKDTIGDYKQQISGKGQDQKYYNKCASYFLERVGHFLLEHDIPGEDLTIVFEERASHDYQKMRNYISKIKDNPMDPRLGYFLAPIIPSRITAVAKTAEPLLCYADLVAFSVSAAIDASKANYAVPEQRYLRELKAKFFSDNTSGAIGEFGLKVFKREQMKLDSHTARFLQSWHRADVRPTLPD
ncbi:DUF3800 domain-containing protein [Phaeobacter sp. HF9A]|uniref:DUF3800 domain-containing protein n=1 Tax=Phaeobacter sp. HF9A TaxID=2721561 RepID=UPI00142FA13D|nr:DUF3800 domain-containing protein [Phaeobacter sp. HF9A]NIZ14412.1 DUF3800 domain-containing protein [Phaeobacter sp. HF9A]